MNNTLVYGRIPEIKVRHDIFASGDIMLRYGEHIRVNRGFGVKHIWIEHQKELVKLGYDSIEKVPDYVSELIYVGAPIYCEFNDIRGNHRIAVLRNKKGIVYLEKKYDGQNNIFYSVITAFTKNKAHGTKIGNVC